MTHPTYPRREELMNTITHGAGAVVGLIAGIFLIVLATFSGDPWRIVSAAVFSISLVLLYSASALYHATPGGPRKFQLEIIDHCAIYLLIAGTYTPFTLVTLRGPWGWSLFGVIWGLAIAGVILKLIFTTRFSLLSTLIYIAMGWLVVVAAVPLINALPLNALVLLVAGGITYTAGTLFYHNRRIPYAHAIWHVFVIAGSVLHYLAVATQVAG
ncbi:MAG: hemolysin III family protein [Oscillochloris sp.]|nr:hemolysin III family protein [Oscillochloris sp.]